MTTPSSRPRKTKRYGWIPDLPDQRDLSYVVPRVVLAQLPARVDLRGLCPREVYDQGELGSCTANAIAAAFEFVQLRRRLPNFMPSRTFIYYNQRVITHTVGYDSGATIRDGVRAVSTQGVCPENSWPYDITRFTCRPESYCFAEAMRSRASSYRRISQGLEQLKGCLAQGVPFVFGFQVYQDFESAEVERTGMVPLPSPEEEPIGGHAVLAVGYDDATGQFLARNSWGGSWGMGGYFTLPYAYLAREDLAADFWVVTDIS